MIRLVVYDRNVQHLPDERMAFLVDDNQSPPKCAGWELTRECNWWTVASSTLEAHLEQCGWVLRNIQHQLGMTRVFQATLGGPEEAFVFRWVENVGANANNILSVLGDMDPKRADEISGAMYAYLKELTETFGDVVEANMFYQDIRALYTPHALTIQPPSI